MVDVESDKFHLPCRPAPRETLLLQQLATRAMLNGSGAGNLQLLGDATIHSPVITCAENHAFSSAPFLRGTQGSGSGEWTQKYKPTKLQLSKYGHARSGEKIFRSKPV